MSNTIVTTLEVDARPAQAGLSAYEQAMAKLAAAQAQQQARQAKIDAAMAREAGALRVVADATGRAAQGWNRLQASVDPAFAAHQRMERAAVQAAAAVRAGAASYGEAAAALDALRVKQEQQARAWTTTGQAANDNIGLAAHQMSNLRSQAIDAGTMLASGSSPLQVLATQSGQVYEALAGHEKGVTGALRALGSSALSAGASVAAALGPVGLAIAGVTAAVAALAYAFREDVPDAAETMKQHSDVIGRVTAQYDDLKAKIEEIGKAEQAIGLRIDLEIDRKNIERQIKAEMRRVDLDFTSYLGQAVFGALDFADAPTRAAFASIRGEVDGFREALKRGQTEAVIPFRQRLEALYELAGNDAPMRSAIEAAMTYTDTLAGLAVNADEAAAALDRLGNGGKTGRLRIYGAPGERDLAPRLDPDSADEIRKRLKDQADELRQAEEAKNRDVAARAAHKLDMAAVTASTACERADVAEHRRTLLEFGASE